VEKKEFRQHFTGLFFGLLSKKEQQRLIHESDESERMLRRQWDHYASMKNYAEKPDLEKVYHNLRQETIKGKKTRNGRPRRLHRRPWRALAALIALLIAVSAANWYYWQYQQAQTVAEVHQRTGKNQRLSLNLPDGSKVTLNSNSELVYPRQFKDGARRVQLNGEAFFRVKDAQHQPFLVHTDDFDVEVTGTAFTVTNYAGKNKARTTLIEGSVQIHSKNVKQNNNTLPLQPNASVAYDKKAGVFTHKQVNADRMTSWRNGILIFDNAPLMRVTGQLENWYGINIHVDEALKQDNRYTMQIRDESLKETLRLLKLTTALRYKIEGDDLYLIARKNTE